MIRLGSLAGYPFEGPRVLAGWTAPKIAAVFAIAYKPNPVAKPEEYGVVYVGHSDDLSSEGLPFSHATSPCWLARVNGKRFELYIATYEAPGAQTPHRGQIARELIAIYRPGCNPEQYDQSWKDHWIGEYETPGTTGPLTTDRDPSGGR
ncbi:MAG: hypothetical protein WD895_00555 [Acidimicrobiia bacterium]